MARRVFLGLAGIVGLGLAGAAVVLLATRQPERAPEVPGSAPAPARDADAVPEAPASPPVQGSQGPSAVQLPPGAVARYLTAALAPCHRVNWMSSGLPAVLMLDLEARDGSGLVVVDVRVASRGGASEGLITCASQVLVGRRVEVGSVPLGERYVARYELTPSSPAAGAPSPGTLPSSQAAGPTPAPSATPPVTRQQVLHRRGGGTR